MLTWRDGGLALACLLLGPPVAEVIFLLGSGISRFGPNAVLALDFGFVIGALPFTYFLTLWANLTVTAANLVARRVTSSANLRLLLALPIGAASYLGFLSWLTQTEGTYLTGELVALGIAGMLAALLPVAVVESFGEREAA